MNPTAGLDEPGANDAPRAAPPRRRAGVVQLILDVLALDRRALLILVTVPVALTALEYFGMPWHYTRFAERTSRLPERMMRPVGDRPPSYAEWIGAAEMPGPPALRPYLWWGAACLVLLVLVPMLVGRVFARIPLRDQGLRLRGTLRDAPTYALLYALFLPVIYLVSTRPDFQSTYPFYKPRVLGWDFVAFEAVYCMQFFAIEYFFRGFMVLGLKPRLGAASILVMLAPYCMIHYYKPFPEAMGAIGAGLLLGALSWRTGTIVYGWFLHYAVAISMDLLALHQTGRL